MLGLSAGIATLMRMPRLGTLMMIANTSIGLVYIMLGVTGYLKFLLPAARIWASVTGIFDVYCGVLEKPWQVCRVSRFKLAWFICAHVSVGIVPAFVLYHYGLRHQKLNLAFGIPVVLAWLNSGVALLNYRGESNALSRTGVGKMVDMSETEGLLHPSDILSTGTGYEEDLQIHINVSSSEW